VKKKPKEAATTPTERRLLAATVLLSLNTSHKHTEMKIKEEEIETGNAWCIAKVEEVVALSLLVSASPPPLPLLPLLPLLLIKAERTWIICGCAVRMCAYVRVSGVCG
jgi:hypothetical protein